MKNKLFGNKDYKRIVNSIKDFEKKYQAMQKEGVYNAHHLISLRNEFEQAYTTDLKNFYTGRTEEIQNSMKQIEEKHKPNYDGVDVQKELLRRQDLERQYKLASDVDLKGLAKEFERTGEGEKTQLELLQLSLKERGFNDETIRLNAYMNEYGINEPYKKDNTYQELQGELLLINQVRNMKLLYMEIDGEYKPFSPAI